MSPRFGVTSKGSNQTRTGVTSTTNYEGAKAFKLDSELGLYSTVCTASLQPKFYTAADKQLTQIRKAIKSVSPEFVAKLAVYAREKMYLRSVPLVLVVELAKVHSGDNLVEKATERVIQRADEITEIMSYYQQANKIAPKEVKPGKVKSLYGISYGIRRGVNRAFEKFDEYQFSKYDRPTDIRIRDVMFLLRPKPPMGKVRLFKKIADDKLEPPYTWEVVLSDRVAKAHAEVKAKKIEDGAAEVFIQRAKKEAWEELIGSKKVGYMATLRNLRNIAQAEVSDAHVKQVLGYVANKEAVQKSRQFPFRFLSAYRELVDTISWNKADMEEALEQAIKHSVENIAGFDSNTRVLIACDTSASMNSLLSQRGSVKYYEIGLVLGMLLQFKCAKAMTGVFGERWKEETFPRQNVLKNAHSFAKKIGEVGHSTNGWLILDWAIKNKVVFDKVMFFTDCQWWDSTGYSWESRNSQQASTYWKRYKDEVNPDAQAYYFDLSGYGTTPLRVGKNDVRFIAGWSDKVFEVMDAIEQGSSAVEEVKKIQL